ncbi:hypothetical protein PR048_012787 [Dryococelus australis]|uniref:Uncharacterized protein n=1 Tax=Dryococelus australis TaxID=614101 RepID=A0ABQ9HQC7_9NEOP|nr:hypothetical protein PR048_012787 [Dryococelus australis]
MEKLLKIRTPVRVNFTKTHKAGMTKTDTDKNETPKNLCGHKLSHLLLFVKNEVEGEQMISLALDGFQIPAQRATRSKMKPEEMENIPIASNLFSG